MIRLKPLRDYQQSDVINLFALNGSTGNEGEFVKVRGSGWVNGNDGRDISLSTDANVTSTYQVNRAEVQLCTSGDDKGDVMGILKKNIRATDYLGRNLIYDETRKAELNAVCSGETVPVIKRGLFLVSGIEGTAAQGSGIAVSNTTAGGWRAYNPAVETSVATLGQILGGLDSESYALCWIDC